MPDLTGCFTTNWRNNDKLPAVIRLTVREAGSERVLSVSTATPVHVDAPARAVSMTMKAAQGAQ